MINISNVSMTFPIPKTYIEILFKPFTVQKNYKALENINLKIDDDDRIAFMGINGAGKTTLLKLIGGLLLPTQGNILINNSDTFRNSMNARKNVGFVLNEERSFYWRLTGYQNMLFFGTLDNLYGDELEVKINSLIKLVGLDNASNRLVANYSSGMKQKLAIARGLISDPEILILDEPTRALDPKSVEEVKDIINQRIHVEKKRTLLIATHKFDEVEKLCNKVCVLKNGEIIAFNSISDIYLKHSSIQEFYNSIH